MEIHITVKCFFFILFSLMMGFGSTYAQTQLDPKDLNPDQLKSAMLYWDYGSPKYLTIESIYPHQKEGKEYWSVIHRSPTPDDMTGNGFDYYLIEKETIRPVKSHMYHLGFTNYQIAFEEGVADVKIMTPTDSTQYQLDLPDYVAPDGPGTPVFIGSLPLSKTFHIQYYELNRWNGQAPKTGQIELTELKVVGTDVLTIDGIAYETYRLNLSSKEGRYTELWVLKNAPHYWVKVNHKVDDSTTVKSQVVKILMLDE